MPRLALPAAATAVQLLLGLCVAPALAANCSQPPIYVDIHKRSVHGSGVFQYGSFIGVGSPAQNQSLWPSLSQNHTTLADASFCANSSLPDCANATRGMFDPVRSTTFAPLAPSLASLDAHPLPANAWNSSTFGTDVLHLYTHYFETDGAWQTNVDHATIEAATQASARGVRPGVVGMGAASTLLQALFDAGQIAARTYSLYLGSGFDRAGGVVNGSITFGGFDAGRFAGAPHRYAMDPAAPNPLRVTIRDVVVAGLPHGAANVSLLDPAAFPALNGSRPPPFAARLSTDQYPLALPRALTANFKTLLGAEPDATWDDGSLRLAPQFNGTSLTVVLDDGFAATLPPDVLFNASGISAVADAPTPGDDDAADDGDALLAAAFLAQVYVMADFDASHFFLGHAVARNAPVMPRTLCAGATPTPYAPRHQPAFVRQGLVGAVVGAVLAAIGIAVLVAVAVLARRRRRRDRARAALDDADSDEDGLRWVFPAHDDKPDDPPKCPDVATVPQFEAPPRTAVPKFRWRR